VDTTCVIYTGDNLENLDVETGEYLDEILQKLNDVVYSQTNFIANSTDSIIGTTGGIAGHSPVFTVRIDPDDENVITVSSAGLMVDSALTGDGKVKVDSEDEKDYLKNQFTAGTDINNIVTITPVAAGGVIYMTPSINIVNLLLYIQENYSELLCSIANACVPDELTTTTSSTSSTTTTSTSTTTTTTTTIGPSDFEITNNSGIAVPFSIYFTDETSLIDYIVDTTTGNAQYSSYQYVGTASTSRLTIQHSPDVSVGIQVFMDGIEIYDQTDFVGSIELDNIDPYADIIINLKTPTTTTTTTSTSTTSTSTSSTSSTSTTSTSSTTTTSTSTSSTTTTSTTTEAQNYYLADTFICGTCEASTDNVLVSFDASYSPTIAKFYVPLAIDGNVYFLTSLTLQPAGPAVALTPFLEFPTCGTACFT